MRHSLFRAPRPVLLPASALALASLLATGCNTCWVGFDTVVGSGQMVDEERAIGAFDRIELHGGMMLDVRSGLSPRVVVHADDNLQEHITTRLEGSTLVIRFKGSVRSDHTLRGEIDLPELREVDISGSSDLNVTGVDGGALAIEVSGSCRGRAEGRVDDLEVRISGSGAMDLRELEARNASIQVSGSGEIELHASETLHVRASGSASVTYTGHPQLTVRTSGSASVRSAP